MELKYIEIFCTVVELKSFSKAAQALSLTQPTISIHIKALEDEFATRLLDRMGRTVTPTREGEILYRYAREIVNLKESARQALESITETIRGKLMIGASTIPGEYILPRYLARFRIAYPDVYPSLRIEDSNDIHERVLSGEVDLGVIGTAVKDKNIVTQKFLEDELILIAPPAHDGPALRESDLAGLPMLAREAGSGSRRSFEDHLKASGIDVDRLSIVAEIGSTQALIQAVKEGMGLAVTSRVAVEDDIRQGLLKSVRIKGFPIRRHFYIITHRLRFQSRICRTFIDFLKPPAGAARRA